MRGLPRSEENHSTNGLQYDAATNTLLVAQGGHTNAGAPSQKFAYTNEYALSAAILAIDLDAIGNTTYDIPTVDDPTRNDTTVFGGNDGLNMAKLVAGGPVQVFSSGFRNSYDLVLTASGRIYTIDNGANTGWGGWPTNEGTANVTNQYNPSEPGSVNNKDQLHLISQGYYGGHPNPLLANPDGRASTPITTTGLRSGVSRVGLGPTLSRRTGCRWLPPWPIQPRATSVCRASMTEPLPPGAAVCRSMAWTNTRLPHSTASSRTILSRHPWAITHCIAFSSAMTARKSRT